jgi:polyisoprenoid-binding protein YceI
MRWILGTAALAAVLLAGPALAAEFALTGGNTKIEFVGSKVNGKHDGGFKSVKGTAAAAAGDPTTLKLNVEIRTDSLYSDNPKLTQHLKSPDFFNVKSQPTAKFVSTKVEKAGGGYTVTGDLTLNGVTKSISFPARINVTEQGLTLSSQFAIDRTAFNMTYGKGKIDDNVALKVTVNATK